MTTPKLTLKTVINGHAEILIASARLKRYQQQARRIINNVPAREKTGKLKALIANMYSELEDSTYVPDILYRQ